MSDVRDEVIRVFGLNKKKTIEELLATGFSVDGKYPLREWTLTVKSACHGHGDYGNEYVAEPREFDSYYYSHLIKNGEKHQVIEKDPELIRLARLGLWAERGSFALDYLYNEVKDMEGIPSEILGVAREALAALPEEKKK